MTRSLPNLQALELFLAVIDEGGLGAASRKLGMHQPNASRMIAQLEKDAQTSLLDRHPRGARPTSAGVIFASHARTLLKAAHDFDQWLHQDAHDEVIELRVGASMTVAEFLMPAWLTHLRQQSPHVKVQLKVLNSTQVLDELAEGTLQLGFVESPRIPEWFNQQVVQEDELVLVTGPQHPWASWHEPLDIRQVAATPLISREGGSGTRDAFEEIVSADALVEPAQTYSSNAAIRVAVAAGAGAAVLSSIAVSSQLASGELVAIPVAHAPLTRPLTAVWTGPNQLFGSLAKLVQIAAQHGGSKRR